jgi:hypothetical protein
MLYDEVLMNNTNSDLDFFKRFIKLKSIKFKRTEIYMNEMKAI